MKRPRVRIYKRETIQAVMEAIDRPLSHIAAEVEGAAKRSMAGGGSEHMPSEPGTPPNVQTGNLRAQITHARTERGSYIVGPTSMAPYGRTHEYGVYPYPDRPFMRPALEMTVQRVMNRFRNLNLANTPTGRRLNSRREKP